MFLDMVSSGRFLTALVLAWIFTPGLFVLMGLVGESRLVPLVKNQSRAFMPGDLFLGWVFATGWYFHPEFDNLLLGIGLAVGGVGLVLMRSKFDGINNYPIRALQSPTKMYHDYILYVGYTAALVSVAVPGVLTSSWDGVVLAKVVALVAFAIWVIGLMIDGLDQGMPQKRPLMHPSDWQPIWRK